MWCVSFALKGQGADLQRLAPERPAVQEGEGLRVYDAGRSHPPALVASGVASSSASEPAFLFSVVHYATLTHPEVRGQVDELRKMNNTYIHDYLFILFCTNNKEIYWKHKWTQFITIVYLFHHLLWFLHRQLKPFL